jgi:ankyrin repeat protein
MIEKFSISILKYFVFTLCFLFLASCRNNAPFPEVDKDKLEIILIRTSCFGSCPNYKVSISGKGLVVFESMSYDENSIFSTGSGIRIPGIHKTKIDPKEVNQLLDQFREARFFSLRDEYRAEVTDNPTYVVRIDTGNGKKSVVDYVGKEAGMPHSVTALQEAIDAAAGTDRWIEGTPQAIPLLQKKGADFRGVLGLNLMDAAAERNDVETMKRLKALGAPIFLSEWPNPLRTAIGKGNGDAIKWLIFHGAIADKAQWKSALQEAVDSDNHFAFRALYLPRRSDPIDSAFATKLLTSAASNADPEIVREMLKRGANANGDKANRNPTSAPPIFEAANGLLSNDHNHPAFDRRSVIRQLLDADADIEHCRNGYCDSVLWAVSDPGVARLLLDAGADPDFKDDEGEHILFSIDDENVALLIISRGANLKAVRPADGKTLRSWGEYQKWPRVLELIDRYGF